MEVRGSVGVREQAEGLDGKSIEINDRTKQRERSGIKYKYSVCTSGTYSLRSRTKDERAK